MADKYRDPDRIGPPLIPGSKTPRNKTLAILISEEEQSFLRQRCKGLGVSLSVFVRQALLTELLTQVDLTEPVHEP